MARREDCPRRGVLFISFLVRTEAILTQRLITVVTQDPEVIREALFAYPCVHGWAATAYLFPVLASTAIDVIYTQELRRRFTAASTACSVVS